MTRSAYLVATRNRAFDVTPAGVTRTDEEPPAAKVAGSTPVPRTYRVAAVGGVLVLALGGGAFFAFRARTPDATPELERSLAVLPFENPSGNPDNEYFSDGITEDIFVHLAGLMTCRSSAAAP